MQIHRNDRNFDGLATSSQTDNQFPTSSERRSDLSLGLFQGLSSKREKKGPGNLITKYTLDNNCEIRITEAIMQMLSNFDGNYFCY
jgi:hypothetical protein